LIKNSQLFGKKNQKTAGGIFFDSHCIFSVTAKPRHHQLAKYFVLILVAIIKVMYNNNTIILCVGKLTLLLHKINIVIII